MFLVENGIYRTNGSCTVGQKKENTFNYFNANYRKEM